MEQEQRENGSTLLMGLFTLKKGGDIWENERKRGEAEEEEEK